MQYMYTCRFQHRYTGAHAYEAILYCRKQSRTFAQAWAMLFWHRLLRNSWHRLLLAPFLYRFTCSFSSIEWITYTMSHSHVQHRMLLHIEYYRFLCWVHEFVPHFRSQSASSSRSALRRSSSNSSFRSRSQEAAQVFFSGCKICTAI